MFNFFINTQGFLDTLPIMGKGMLGIFAVTAVIFLFILIINAASKKKSGK